MKKLIIKCVILVVIMLGVSNYMLYIMTGKTPFSSDDLKLPELSSDSVSKLVPAKKETVFKWRDENGVLHYSSEPPPGDGSAVEQMEVDPNVNLIEGIRPQEDISPAQQQPEPNLDFSGNVYSPENVKKLVDDAKKVQEKLNDRYEKLEDM